MPPPAKREKATTYRRDSSEVAKLCLRLMLIAETESRSLAIAILLVIFKFKYYISFILYYAINQQKNIKTAST